MMMLDIIKVLRFAEENGLNIGTKEGIIITDKEGCLLFESDSKTECFKQACAWIDKNRTKF